MSLLFVDRKCLKTCEYFCWIFDTFLGCNLWFLMELKNLLNFRKIRGIFLMKNLMDSELKTRVEPTKANAWMIILMELNSEKKAFAQVDTKHPTTKISKITNCRWLKHFEAWTSFDIFFSLFPLKASTFLLRKFKCNKHQLSMFNIRNFRQ